MKTLKELLKEINDWQDSVFTKATPLSAVAHLEREVKELSMAIMGSLYPSDKKSIESELADCFLLVAGVAHLSGIDLEQAIKEKMAINRRRIWGEPDKDGVVEHIRNSFSGLQEWIDMPIDRDGAVIMPAEFEEQQQTEFKAELNFLKREED